MTIRKTLLLTAACGMLLSFAASCITPKQVLYLQDMDTTSQIELENKFEARIVPYDRLSITVSCYDEELAKPFNLNQMAGSNGGYGSSGNGGDNLNGHLVDVNGDILFPVLGRIHVAGLTRLKLQELITRMLKDGGYISDPLVIVRFASFKIFFLGADGGKTIDIPNERCTFLEALAYAGDISVYTKRDKIAVVREENGKMTMRYLDPRSTKVFNDPYYMLRQNDFIITQSIGGKYYQDETRYWLSWLTLGTSLVTVITSILTVAVLSKK